MIIIEIVFNLNVFISIIQALLDMNDKLELTQKDSYMNDGIVSQLRGLLRNQEVIRGKSYYDTEPINTQTTSMLMHTLERCFNELHAEILTAKERAAQVNMRNNSLLN